MGLFWADQPAKEIKKTSSGAGWFWSAQSSSKSDSPCPYKPNEATAKTSQDISACPVMHKKDNKQAASSGGDISACPVMHKKDNKPAVASSGDISACPVMHKGAKGASSDTETYGHINPLNNMPSNIPDQKQPWQKLDLPTERTLSSIPKGDGTPWEYPSPQQMYNAMIRKGKIDPNTGEEIPEDAVESMVFVHNFLNEGCWQEVLEWEKKYSSNEIPTKLLKFMGRPDDLSPRARLFHYLSYVFPSQFYNALPFDRHDWYILRPDPSSQLNGAHPGYKEVRYVIDFYEGPDDEEGMPTFNLDVRPALDNFENCKDRVIYWGKPILQQLFESEKKN